ncbi:MAG: hypothetical protein RJA10_732 [Pseudomonadota bacterium]
MHAATQHIQGTMPAARGPLRLKQHALLRSLPAALGTRPTLMTIASPRQFHIIGITLEGKAFRPSDWAERLASAMSSFRPGGGQGGIGAFIGYSPYCVPQVVNGTKCVLVNEALRDIEPMAWDFVMNFARDNELQVEEITRG